MKRVKVNNNFNENDEFGLTPLQQKGALLYLQGKSITDIADELGIDRSTFYLWKNSIKFRSYCNLLQDNIRTEIYFKFINIYENAIKAIDSMLISENEMIKFKTAHWVLEKLFTSIEKDKIIENEIIDKSIRYDSNLQKFKFNTEIYLNECIEKGVNPTKIF